MTIRDRGDVIVAQHCEHVMYWNDEWYSDENVHVILHWMVVGAVCLLVVSYWLLLRSGSVQPCWFSGCCGLNMVSATLLLFRYRTDANIPFMSSRLLDDKCNNFDAKS